MSKKLQDSCLIPYRGVVSATLNASATTIAISPNATFPRLLTEADAWALFRVRSLKFRLLTMSYPATLGTATVFAACYLPGVQDTVPSTITQFGEALAGVHMVDEQTQPTQWVTVPKCDLSGPIPWYKTFPGVAVYEETFPGSIYVRNFTATAQIYYLEVKALFEFKGAVNTANTPLFEKARSVRLALHQEKERAALLKLIKGPTTPLLEL